MILVFGIDTAGKTTIHYTFRFNEMLPGISTVFVKEVKTSSTQVPVSISKILTAKSIPEAS